MREETEEKRGVAACLDNIGLIYYEQHNFDDAMKYIGDALKANTELAYTYGIVACDNNLGNVYFDDAEAQKNPDSASQLFSKSLHCYDLVLKLEEIQGDSD